MGINELILAIAKQEERVASIEQISKNLLKQGLDIQLIHEATSMPIKKLKKLKREMRTH